MTVGDVLDGAFRGLRATFGPVALVVLLIIAPYQLLSNLVIRALVPDFLLDPFPTEEAFLPDGEAMVFEDLSTLFGASTVLGLIGLLVNVVVGAAVVAMVLRVDRGEPAEVGAAVRTGFSRAGTTVAATVLVVIAGIAVGVVAILVLTLVTTVLPPLGILMIVLSIPVAVCLAGLFVGVGLLAIAIAVAEGRGPIATLGRALWVLRVRFWRLLGITLLALLIVTVITTALAVPFFLLSLVAGPADWVVQSIGDILTSVVTVPILLIAALLVYLDARVRFEAYDLEVRTRGLGPA